VDGIYHGWLLGVNSPSDGPLTPLEQTLIASLDELADSDLSDSSLVPRVPAVLPGLMADLRDEGASGRQLARQIAQDAGLVGEVIRVANSPYYRTRVRIASLEQAVTLLGRNGLRQLVARVAFKPLLNLHSGHFVGLAAPRVWAQAEACAVAGRCLSHGAGTDGFEAYLCGLLQNVGVIAALRTIDCTYDGSDVPRSTAFHHAFATRSRLLSARILEHWDLPASIRRALADQAGTPGGRRSGLGELLHAADVISKLRLLADNGVVDDGPGQVSAALDGRWAEAVARCYTTLAGSPPADSGDWNRPQDPTGT